MKNKIFKNLSMEKKQDILIHILRSKTNGLLKVTEEVALLSAGLKRKQFQIRTFNDISFLRRHWTRPRTLVSKRFTVRWR